MEIGILQVMYIQTCIFITKCRIRYCKENVDCAFKSKHCKHEKDCSYLCTYYTFLES